MYDPRPSIFFTDMNCSDSITLGDIGLTVKWLYFYPGDAFIHFVVNHVPDMGQLVRITYSSYGGVLSGIVSFFVWGIVFGMAWGMVKCCTKD